MISKNNIIPLSTQSVFNTAKVNNGIESNPAPNRINVDESINLIFNGIESNPESNGINVDESINLDTGESTSRMDVDESINSGTGVGTKRVYGVEVSPPGYGVEVSPGKVNSESTISTDEDESVSEGNRFKGVFNDDSHNSPDTN